MSKDITHEIEKSYITFINVIERLKRIKIEGEAYTNERAELLAELKRKHDEIHVLAETRIPVFDLYKKHPDEFQAILTDHILAEQFTSIRMQVIVGVLAFIIVLTSNAVGATEVKHQSIATTWLGGWGEVLLAWASMQVLFFILHFHTKMTSVFYYRTSSSYIYLIGKCKTLDHIEDSLKYLQKSGYISQQEYYRIRY